MVEAGLITYGTGLVITFCIMLCICLKKQKFEKYDAVWISIVSLIWPVGWLATINAFIMIFFANLIEGWKERDDFNEYMKRIESNNPSYYGGLKLYKEDDDDEPLCGVPK